MFPKSLIRSLYDLQHIRIQTGNRICAEIKIRLGQLPGKPEKDLGEKEQMYLKEARQEFKRIADCFVLSRADKYLKVKFEDYKIISDPAMLIFVETYVKQLDYEDKIEKIVAQIVKQSPIWREFLEPIKGIGPLMSAVILSEFDIHKAERISHFWKYAGLDVADDGRGRGRYKEHLVKQKYTNKDGKEAERDSITFNPFLKTKLVGVLGSCFLKQSPEKCIYRQIYDAYKHRLENHPVHKEKTKGHRHNMAIRYMIKIFLQDLWLAWREIEGLPITLPYSEIILGHKHIA